MTQKNRSKSLGFFVWTRLTSRQLKLLQELQVVLEEQAQVVDAVFQHGDAFHTHAEGETGVFFWVDAAGSEDVGVAHATTQDFNPTCVLADVAALATADVA